MKFHAPAVGYRRLQVHVVVGPAATVGDRQIKCLGKRRNLDRFSVTADRANVGLSDVDRVIGDQLAMTKSMTFVLPGCYMGIDVWRRRSASRTASF